MTQQETKAVEEFAAKISQEPTMSIQCNQMQIEHRGFLHGLYNGVIHGAQFLDELRKPSKPKTNVGEAGEELVKRILNIMDNNAKDDDSEAEYLLGGQFEEVATEIAALVQPDKELLEALKETDKDLCVLESTMLQIEQRDHLAEGMTELVKKWRARNKQAISNYEKQSK
jgi:hypothetical protein